MSADEGASQLKKKKKSKLKSGLMLLKLQFSFQGPETSGLLLKNVHCRSTISKIKARLEQELGILPDMYSMSYLDRVPMEDSRKLSEYDVVDNGTLRINLWRIWQDLFKAAFLGDIKDCFSCSLDICGKSDWSKYCAWAALFVASHHGHHNLVAELLKKTEVEINSTSPCGWTALHAAACMGRWKVLCMLIDYGVDVRINDLRGFTAHNLAHDHGHKMCENSLSFCQWNLQKHRTVQERKLDYDAQYDRHLSTRLTHQQVDSSLGIDYRGTHGQLYRAHISNPITVAKVKTFQERKASYPLAKEKLHAKIEKDLSCHNTTGKLDFNYGWFDELRAQQLIPSTKDIIRYSDPSSCELRPRSLLNPGGFKVKLYSPPPAPTSPLPSASSSARGSGSHTGSKKTLKVGGAPDLRTPKVKVTHVF